MKTNKSVINLEKGVEFFTDEKEKLERVEKRGIKYILKKFINPRKNDYNTRAI